MSVRLRLRRDGAKKRPFYHLVAADCRRARNGRFIEELGYYNPIVAADAEPIIELREERVRYWLSVGAQPSDTATALLKKVGILERTAAPAKPASATTAATATETTDETTGDSTGDSTGDTTATSAEAASTEAAEASETVAAE